MKTTPNMGLTYPESGDHTRTWEYWQALADGVDAWAGPRVRLSRSADFPLTSGRDTGVPWEKADYAVPATMWTSGEWVTAPVPGVYAFTGWTRFGYVNPPAGQRQVFFEHSDGSRFAQHNSPGVPGATFLSLAGEIELAAGERVRMVVNQSQGTNVPISGSAFTVRLVGAPTGAQLSNPRGFPREIDPAR